MIGSPYSTKSPSSARRATISTLAGASTGRVSRNTSIDASASFAATAAPPEARRPPPRAGVVSKLHSWLNSP